MKGQCGGRGWPPAEAGETSLESGGLTAAGGQVVFREVMENRSGAQ